MTLRDLRIDPSWTLFLDRDGVINRRIVGGYVKKWDEMGFLPGVPEALATFSKLFEIVVVVSNQQGVGKGLMTADDVNDIHRRMSAEIKANGGRIDAFYFSPHLASEQSFMRKPNIGMALKARKQFRSISFKRSLMAGDSISDMIFGKRTGMTTVLIAPDPVLARRHPHLIDFVFPDLLSLSKAI